MIKSSYVVISIKQLTDRFISESVNDKKRLRFNDTKSKVIIKFDSSFPEVAKGHDKLSHAEILIELAKLEWTIDDATQVVPPK